MPSPSKKPTTNVRPVPGTIVWVRRRNGSWWPGRIISKKELLASNVMSPRSGTPVKLLGRDDASVDWYNIEKSKRVKAFRCGEFDDCIEKAQAMVAGSQSKRREKYARREDAIADAIELEKEQLEQEEQEQQQMMIKSAPAAAAAASGGGGKTGGGKKSSKQKGKQTGGEQTKKGGKSSKKGGPAMKAAQQGGGEKEKDREASDPELAPALAPRMRGLQDLVSAGTSSKISSIEGLDGGSSEASLPDEKEAPPQGKAAMKRKRTGGGGGGGGGKAEELPLPASKRRDRKRAIAQVLETSSQEPSGGGGGGGAAVEEPQQQQAETEKGTGKGEVCNGDDKLSDEESAQETIMNPAAPPEKDSHLLDAHSASYNGKEAPAPSSCVEGGALPSLPSSPSALLQEKAQEKAGQEKAAQEKSLEKAQVKKEKASRRKKAAPAPRTLASRIEAPASKEEKQPEPDEQHNLEQKSTGSRLEPSSVTEKEKAAEVEETVTACCPSPKSEEQKETYREGFTGPCHPRTRFEKQPVPVVPLYSSMIQNSVHGYPVSVEVVKSIGPLWQTSKRTSRQRAPPRYDLPGYDSDEYAVKVPGTGKAPKKSKEALSKKLLKRAVLTSKKIRTLASISEERRRQPFTEILSSELPPRWPVATLVPVSVALNRLRTIVCS